MLNIFKWFQNKKELLKSVESLTIENNELKERNKKCQETINKTNSHYKGILKRKSKS